MRKDTRVVYGAQCTWWDDIDKVGNNGVLPCCPHCKGMLFQMESPGEWFRFVDEHERDGFPGYRAFIEWVRGKCFTEGWKAAKAAYERRLQ